MKVVYQYFVHSYVCPIKKKQYWTFCYFLFFVLDSENIFGYKGLKIQLFYTAGRLTAYLNKVCTSEIKKNMFDGVQVSKWQELNSATTLASQPAVGHSLSFIFTIGIMTLCWGLCGAGHRKLQPNLAPMLKALKFID